MTARLARFFSFPLLAKELTEAAARRRTYVTRVLYALLLYAIFALMMPRWLWRPGTSPLQVMGAGRELFEQLILLQAAGIGLFLPALMCGRIAQEKERDSLVLLLLTELKPWRILLEKYVGGLVPMLTFLLLGMPLAAIAYALGGVTPLALAGYLFALIVACLQVGAIALFCSAWCRTTVGAFLGTYFIAAVFYLGPILLWEVLNELGPDYPADNFFRDTEEWSFIHIPFYVVARMLRELQNLSSSGWKEGDWLANLSLFFGSPWALSGTSSVRSVNSFMATPSGAFWKLLPSLLSIPAILALARLVFVRRAFAPASHFFLKIFRFIDAVMKRSNRIVGNVMLVRERENLPGDQPIYWRETARRALGKVHYLVRILVVVEIPTLFIAMLLASIDYGGQAEELTALAAFLVALAAIALSVQAANAIVSERVQQTLEVLLTTTLSGRDIVRQKARALYRLAWVAAIPLLTVFAVECWLESGTGPASWEAYRRVSPDGALAYAVCAVAMVVIYLPMIIWLSLWIGLRVRTRFRAIITALVALILWGTLPIAAMMAVLWITESSESSSPFICSISLLSPLTVGVINEFGKLHEFPWKIRSPWLVIIFNAVFYLGITLLLRRHALTHADRWLRR